MHLYFNTIAYMSVFPFLHNNYKSFKINSGVSFYKGDMTFVCPCQSVALLSSLNSYMHGITEFKNLNITWTLYLKSGSNLHFASICQYNFPQLLTKVSEGSGESYHPKVPYLIYNPAPNWRTRWIHIINKHHVWHILLGQIWDPDGQERGKVWQ